ncbi:hypothetical protein AB9R79_17475, partial [Vibrio splendidus]
MECKIGLIISVYDKVDDLTICVELAKLAGFSSILVVAEDEEKSRKALEKFQLAPIKFVSSCEYQTNGNSKFDFFKQVTCRVWQAQRVGLSELCDDTDFIMHTHADGWVLDGKKIDQIVEVLQRDNLDFAYRGMGLTFRNFPGSPTGTLDDHFYIIRSKFVATSRFIHKPLIDYVPGYFNIHGILSMWLISEIGISNSWHYDDSKGWLNWDNSRRNYIAGNPLRPCVYNSEYSLLHCHSDDFPVNTGRAIQAKFLDEEKLGLESKIISEFIESNLDNTAVLELVNENDKNLKLSRAFFDYDDNHRNCIITKNKIVKYKKKPIKSIFYNISKLLYKKYFKKIITKKSFSVYPLLL